MDKPTKNKPTENKPIENGKKSTDYLASIRRDVELTVANYSNMQRRLSLRNTFTEIMLVAYSFFSIFNDLIPHFKELSPEKLNTLDFVNISFSIAFLYFALQVGFANYASRCSKLEVTIQKLKYVTQELKVYCETGMTKDEYTKELTKYRDIIDGVEIVPLRDFYKTCKKNDPESLTKKFLWVERFMCLMFGVFECILACVVIVAPVVLYVYIFLIK